MYWNNVKTKEDLPQDNEFVLICFKGNNGDIIYFKPEYWNEDNFTAKLFLVFKTYDEMAWCKIDAPIF